MAYNRLNIFKFYKLWYMCTSMEPLPQSRRYLSHKEYKKFLMTFVKPCLLALSLDTEIFPDCTSEVQVVPWWEPTRVLAGGSQMLICEPLLKDCIKILWENSFKRPTIWEFFSRISDKFCLGLRLMFQRHSSGFSYIKWGWETLL